MAPSPDNTFDMAKFILFHEDIFPLFLMAYKLGKQKEKCLSVSQPVCKRSNMVRNWTEMNFERLNLMAKSQINLNEDYALGTPEHCLGASSLRSWLILREEHVIFKSQPDVRVRNCSWSFFPSFRVQYVGTSPKLRMFQDKASE